MRPENYSNILIQSGSFQELIDQDYQIFPEQNEVMTEYWIPYWIKRTLLSYRQNMQNFLHCRIRSILIFCIIRWKQYEEMRYVKELIVLLIRRKHCLHFSRYTITDTGNLVSVEDELENVENYFKITAVSFWR